MKSENIAKAIGRNLPVSTKKTIEVCNWIRGMNTLKAKKRLQDVIDMKIVVPFKRFDGDRGHKRGNIAAGGYPVKASQAILSIIKSAESNASSKGLNTSSLIIKQIIPNKAASSYRYGRRRGLKTKSTHIEVVIEEIKKTAKEDKKKEVKKEKTESKEEKKEEEKKPVEDKKKEKKEEKKETAEKKEVSKKTELKKEEKKKPETKDMENKEEAKADKKEEDTKKPAKKSKEEKKEPAKAEENKK